MDTRDNSYSSSVDTDDRKVYYQRNRGVRQQRQVIIMKQADGSTMLSQTNILFHVLSRARKKVEKQTVCTALSLMIG